MPKILTSRFTEADVQNIGAKLDLLPKKSRVLSVREIVVLLRPQILALRQRGYTLTEVAAELAHEGVNVSMSALKSLGPQAKKPVQKRIMKPVEALQPTPIASEFTHEL